MEESISSNEYLEQQNSIDYILDFKSIFAHNRKYDKTIIFLKKTEFDIFYSYKCKYPLLVKETITSLTGKTDKNEIRIDRRNIIDEFKIDHEIPKQYQHTVSDYENTKAYGVSYGHNAPAGQHKTNMTVFNETFLFSNITPQESVFNSGLWALLENWCKLLAKNKNIYNITIFTGSIPDSKNIDIPIHTDATSDGMTDATSDGMSDATSDGMSDGMSTTNSKINMNIPQKMFKIVCFQHIDKPKKIFMEIFIANNAPYYINPKSNIYKLNQFLVPIKAWGWFENYSGIDIKNLLIFYSFVVNKENHSNTHSHSHSSIQYSNSNVRCFRDIIPIEIYLSIPLQLLMKKSNWFGYLLYANTIQELDNKWEECKLQNFENMNYYDNVYECVKRKLIYESQYKLYPLSIFANKYNKKNHKTNNKYTKYTNVLSRTHIRKPHTHKTHTQKAHKHKNYKL